MVQLRSKRLNNLIKNSFFLCILCTLLSQVPYFSESNLALIFQLVWFLPLFLLAFSGNFSINKLVIYLFFLSFFLFVYALLMDGVSANSYLKISHVSNMLKSFFVVFVSYQISHFINFNEFANKLGWISLLGGLILSLTIYQFAFLGDFDIRSRMYAYGSKNSAAQIILTCLIFVIYLFRSKKLMFKILKVIFILIALYLLLVLKSRGTLLGLIIVFLFTLKQKVNLTLRRYVLILGVLGLIFVFLNDEIKDILINGIILAGRDSSDLNDASSGRLDFFLSFPSLFYDNIIFGRGLYFSESFPLSVLLQLGLLGGSIVFLYTLSPMFFFKKYMTIKNPLEICFLLLIITYYLNGLFEEQAPLGPGVKNFFLWVLFGFFISKFNRKINNLI